MRRARIPLLLASAITTACSDPSSGTSQTTPVISLTLVEGETLQVASVFLATPGDSAIPSRGVPVGGADVALQVEDSSGTVWALSASVVPGEFTATMSPQRNALYRLRGIVLGRAILAATRVPADFEVVRPTADTITNTDVTACTSPGLSGGMVCVSVDMVGDSTLTMHYQMTDLAGPFPEVGGLVRGRSELRLFPSSRVRELLMVAVSADAAAWLSGSNPRSNINGGFGGFGSALVIRRSVLIP